MTIEEVGNVLLCLVLFCILCFDVYLTYLFYLFLKKGIHHFDEEERERIRRRTIVQNEDYFEKNG